MRDPPNIGRRGRSAFTLTELLVVIGIVVLVLGMATAAFRALTGSRSAEAAENLISAMLGRVREEAIGQQQSRGVFFFTDPGTGRVNMGVVYPTSPVGMVPVQLDLVADQDIQLLPPGVGVQVVAPPISASPAGSYSVAGVILFDGDGLLANTTYAVTPNASAGSLARVLQPVRGFKLPWILQPAATGFGVVTYDQETYAAQPNPTPFLDGSADALMVNRYNGTVVKGQ